MNLLAETIDNLKMYYHDESQVLWVGSYDGRLCVSWEEFKEIAASVSKTSFGTDQIAEDIVIVGENWWLERHHDGSFSWWVHRQVPKKTRKHKSFRLILHEQGGDLESINRLIDNDGGEKC